MRATSLDQFRLPGRSDRTAIYGRTGDGKTVLASWLLSEAPIDRMPYYVLDFKGDDLLRSIKRFEQVSLRDKITKHPGVYIARPMPHQTEAVEDFLWRVWAKRNTGLFVDEGFMLPRPSHAYDAILTQGRSLHIPVINLTQRPVMLTRFVPTQSDFHFLFPFNDDRDNETAAQVMPRAIRDQVIGHDEADNVLPKYHSFWYDVSNKVWSIIGPAPRPEIIAQRFDDRLRPTKVKL